MGQSLSIQGHRSSLESDSPSGNGIAKNTPVRTGPFIPECEPRPEGASCNDPDYCPKKTEHISVSEFLKHPKQSKKSRHESCVESVRILSNLTARVQTCKTSHERPRYFPGTKSHYPYAELRGSHTSVRYATGYLTSCMFPRDGNCPCSKCKGSNKEYWMCLVATATHAICDLEEAEHSQFEFFYDDEKALETGKAKVIFGTDITYDDFRKFHENFLKSENQAVQSSGLKEMFFLEKSFEHPHATDVNVVVCVTHCKDTAKMLNCAWSDWTKFVARDKNAFQMVLRHTGVVSHFHGGPKMVSLGHNCEDATVNLKDMVLEPESVTRSNNKKERLFFPWYTVVSNTSNRFIPVNSWLVLPSRLTLNDLILSRDEATIPAQTEVWMDDSNGGFLCHSLRKETKVPLDSLKLSYFSYDTPTCPGSSGAMAVADLSGKPPRYPDMVSWENRLSSFKAKYQSESKCRHLPEELAIGGLFYTGDKDCVRCFYCGQGMKGWYPPDDMYKVHQRLRPDCSFLKAILKSGNKDNYKMLVDLRTAEILVSEEQMALCLVQREHIYHQQRQLCRACFRNPALEILLPCGDLVICTPCSEILSACPYCHTKVQATATVYLP